MNENLVLRGFIASVDIIPPLIFTFQYNPQSISDNKGVTYADANNALCGNAPGKFYVGGGDRVISFSFKLDGLERGTDRLNPTANDNGISTELAKLRSFLYPREDAWKVLGGAIPGGMRLASPPSCYFGFGSRLLQGTITQMQITETQFNYLLAPVRADVSITIVVEESAGDVLHELDRQRRNRLAGLGLQNLGIFGTSFIDTFNLMPR